jgi:sugar-specific transcriptional regulator TrmB/predicted hydrocarbon binding protein
MARARNGLLDLLVAHGVPEPAARIYLVASREGPLTASELARATAIHRVHGYRFIRELVEQGLLRGAGARPTRFSALPVDELVDKWIQGTTEELERLRRDRAKLVEEIREDGPETPGLAGRRFSIIEGQDAIHAYLRRRIGAVRKEVLISVGGFALARAIDGGIDRALAAARQRGVRVRVVTEVNPSNLSEVKLFAPAAEVRHATRPVTNRAVLLDRSQLSLFVSGEDGLGAAGDAQLLLSTCDPHFAALAREYHQQLWAHAVPVTERLVELESPPRAVLPVGRGQMNETFQRLREITELGMAATGMQEVSIDLPDLIQAVAAQLGHEIGDAIEGRTPEEVVRALSEYYARHSRGRMAVVRERPLTVKVTNCFACRNTPEIGRVLCPALIGAALERRLGGHWDVSKPDPARHAVRGCVFALTPG